MQTCVVKAQQQETQPQNTIPIFPKAEVLLRRLGALSLDFGAGHTRGLVSIFPEGGREGRRERSSALLIPAL